MNHVSFSPANSTTADHAIDDRHQSVEERPTDARPTGRRGHRESPTRVTPPVQPQSRCVHENNQRLLTWNISLIDDQDEVSENVLMMHNEPSKVAEKFGPAILKIPAYIKKEADELFKPSEINSTEQFDLINLRVSGILSSSYQQYIKSIPPTVLEKRERHVLYPWTRWNESMATRHRPSGNTAVASPREFDRSSLLHCSSPIQPQRAHAAFGRWSNNGNGSNTLSISSGSSNHNNTISSSGNDGYSGIGSSGYNNDNEHIDIDNSNRLGYCFDELTSRSYGGLAADDPSYAHCTTDAMAMPVRFARMARSQSDVNRSDVNRSASPSSDSCRDRSMPSPVPMLVSPSPPSPANRVYYSVDADGSTVSRLVEHYCTFCYKNQEPPAVYGSHLLRDAVRITCPKLRALRCKHCNGTGDNAHTMKYCPFLYVNYK